MVQQLLLNLGPGTWQTGFATVTAQRWETSQPPVQFTGSLPPAPALATEYQRWQQLYSALYGPRAYWRQPPEPTEYLSSELTNRPSAGTQAPAAGFEFETETLTHVSHHAFETLGVSLKTALSHWLSSVGFISIERQLRTQLSPSDSIQVMLTAQDKTVLRFPWRLWSLFEDYPKAELSVHLPAYSRSLKQNLPDKTLGKVKILAILGSDEGIDVDTDRQLLDQLPEAEVSLLLQPTLSELQQQLWNSQWDVLFFAGHSSSQAQGDLHTDLPQKGCLQINAIESLTIEQLKYGLQRSIEKGLRLVILNSCDGLGLAWELADLHLPQAIVMREPVSDAISQQFLKAFLGAFSRGESLYLSVRDARERLHGQPGNYAALLPVIVQNPAEVPPTWQDLTGQIGNRLAGNELEENGSAENRATGNSAEKNRLKEKASSERPLSGQHVASQPVASAGRWLTALTAHTLKPLAIAIAVLGLRWGGLLQGLELQTYDMLMKLRPLELPDSRIVVVTVDESDIQRQTSSERRGSLSDETLQQVLSLLNSYQPRVIALDLYRDFPALTPELAASLARPNLIGVCKSRDPLADETGIRSAPEMAADQVGFSDFIEETDGILRRQLLTLTPDPVSTCTTPYGFAALTAIHYLSKENLQPTFTQQGDLKIGETIFPRVAARTGGLQQIDNRGNQVLINYRSLPHPDQIAANIPLQQLLLGEVNGEQVRDRIVLIGVTAPSGDYWATPYGVQGQDKTAGVFVQAQMTSQLISAVLDERPLIWVWPQWTESMCIVLMAVGTAVVGRKLLQPGNTTQLMGFYIVIGGGCTTIAWATLIGGGWLPLVPILFTLGGSALSQVLSQTSGARQAVPRKQIDEGR